MDTVSNSCDRVATQPDVGETRTRRSEHLDDKLPLPATDVITRVFTACIRTEES